MSPSSLLTPNLLLAFLTDHELHALMMCSSELRRLYLSLPHFLQKAARSRDGDSPRWSSVEALPIPGHFVARDLGNLGYDYSAWLATCAEAYALYSTGQGPNHVSFAAQRQQPPTTLAPSTPTFGPDAVLYVREVWFNAIGAALSKVGESERPKLCVLRPDNLFNGYPVGTLGRVTWHGEAVTFQCDTLAIYLDARTPPLERLRAVTRKLRLFVGAGCGELDKDAVLRNVKFQRITVSPMWGAASSPIPSGALNLSWFNLPKDNLAYPCPYAVDSYRKPWFKHPLPPPALSPAFVTCLRVDGLAALCDPLTKRLLYPNARIVTIDYVNTRHTLALMSWIRRNPQLLALRVRLVHAFADEQGVEVRRQQRKALCDLLWQRGVCVLELIVADANILELR